MYFEDSWMEDNIEVYTGWEYDDAARTLEGSYRRHAVRKVASGRPCYTLSTSFRSFHFPRETTEREVQILLPDFA